MVNYQLGKIYKIVCRITGEVYVGSTCEKTLARRLVVHRSSCKLFYEKNKCSYISSYPIILRGDYYIDLLENSPCNNNDELRRKEREYYDKIECINKNRPSYQNKEEKRDLIYEIHKKYRENNRELVNKIEICH